MKANNEPFEIAGETVEPGERARIDIPVARLASGDWLSLVVEVINGVRPGPSVWLSGAIHGDELDGVEIVRSVLSALDPAHMAGRVLGIPVVNVFGFITESRYLPDRRDLNRTFPGRETGSLTSRLAHIFMSNVVAHCDVGLDYHCGSDGRENLPQVRCNLDDPETRSLALAFGAPVTIHGKPPAGSLRKAALKVGARVLLYEAGEAGRFTWPAIERGTEGSLRVLRELGVLEDDGSPPPDTVESRKMHWIRAPRSGVCRIAVDLGARVKKGQTLGTVSALVGEDGVAIRSAHPGIVVGRRVKPLVYQGEALLNVAAPVKE